MHPINSSAAAALSTALVRLTQGTVDRGSSARANGEQQQHVALVTPDDNTLHTTACNEVLLVWRQVGLGFCWITTIPVFVCATVRAMFQPAAQHFPSAPYQAHVGHVRTR